MVFKGPGSAFFVSLECSGKGPAMIVNHSGKILIRRICQILAILFIPLFHACSGPLGITPVEVAYREIIADSVLAHPENRYQILVPEGLDASRALPLVIVIDAHGDGAMAAGKFRPAVRHFPCLVAGSDLIRNNIQGYEKALMQLLDDIMKKYPVDRQNIIISGFSGGARMAFAFALHYPVRGVLMCGAGPGEEGPSCPVYAISGRGDFNFSEQYVRPDPRSLSDDRFTADYFHGIHEWPGPQQLSDALFFLLREMKQMDPLRKKRSDELLRMADSLETSGDRIMAWKSIEKAAKISVGNGEKERALQKGEALLNEATFRDAIRTLEHDLQQEKSLQQTYYDHLLSGNTGWWKDELSRLRSQIENTGNGPEKDHYLRLKGYIGILLYSVINQVIHSDPGNARLEGMLDIYQMAEPENPDVYYFRALHACQSGNRESCAENLKRSLELGFTDTRKLKDEFPADILNPPS